MVTFTFAAIGILDWTWKQTKKTEKLQKPFVRQSWQKMCRHANAYSCRLSDRRRQQKMQETRLNFSRNANRLAFSSIFELNASTTHVRRNICHFGKSDGFVLFFMILRQKKINTEENWLILAPMKHYWLRRNDSRWMARCDQQRVDQLICSKNTTTGAPMTAHCVTHKQQRTVKQSNTNVFLHSVYKVLSSDRTQRKKTKQSTQLFFLCLCICVSAFRPYWCFQNTVCQTHNRSALAQTQHLNTIVYNDQAFPLTQSNKCTSIHRYIVWKKNRKFIWKIVRFSQFSVNC